MHISVLMSLYSGTQADEFARCLQSIAEQTLQPDEMVVVLDGPVDSAVLKTLEQFKSALSVPFNLLTFEHNRGLGEALADGINACRYPLVARVDTDDINLPERFALQHARLIADDSLALVGGLMQERMIDQSAEPQGMLTRSVPLTHDAIFHAARYRNPLNHPTVMFRRDAVLDAGNYRSMLWFEDFDLWARMLQRGCRFANLDQILVEARADDNYFRRRGGLRYFKQEVRLARAFRDSGFHRWWQSIRFLATRFSFRIVPLGLRSWLYVRMLRQRRPDGG